MPFPLAHPGSRADKPSMWEWLGEPSLAMDLANTVKRRGAEDVDWLRTGDDLANWARLTPGDVPVVSPGAERLGEIRAFRDDVIEVLRAVRDGAAPPSGALARLNWAARRVPV